MSEQANIKHISVRLTDGTTIKGKINIKKYNRIPDFLNRGEDQFIVLFGASMAGSINKVAIIKKDQIVWAMPED